ncbi:hypothetical protein AB0T83_06955 [Fluviibacterium sp. DFM31]|uniref:RcnB family protein n=1 Tax=Meridianimarinicoccus marinus TaxID=3231483 RepID=A0ABV3L4K5_9RHOB
MPIKLLALPLLVLSLAASAGWAGNHKDNPGKSKGNGHRTSLTAGNSGKIPPGQIKRYTRGAKLPADLDYVRITDLSRYKLPKPGKGQSYVIIDDEIVEIINDTNTVVDAIGIVADWLN